ncbi:hypothetical protein NVP1271B_70 [Vibrio phage 1.271.B._10N.286.54.B4]|nr:hypothetical protein NVP1027O_70 [Vibrio phage 1.027.O._10N.286.54.B8]AUR94450.1 hypothetical protein NVP1194O_70 [Vibrio phage 1.194.O._10N.286.54.B1]AUR94538.1 hypothetical protein NVP1195O_73 [Vibrio phage 1.195.O._10N.286.54.C8]AUR94623.1 hypothetical protein NVP1196O_70 [Vibrio phage 1.196.O._10N.286.54.E12]AUR95090.1 hypothetical protein NVP1200O_70 [Vibrio phage 1.200.O._10N.286.55.E1]AUR99578.1 hypothetical protein NVP1267O_70 [Vibrio phage 1.267.O._10N.286.54.A1]AUR99663.1 hypothe
MTDTTPHTEHLPEELTEWAERFNIGPDALFSLYQILTIPLGSAAVGEYEKNSETYVQNVLRVLASSREHAYLWRNNVGATQTPDGRMIRYGLCNESKKLNQRFKSSDLIGGTPVTVTPDMVGKRVMIFTAVEVKKADWKPGSDTQRERGQLRFINAVRAAGGFGFFCRDSAVYSRFLEHWKIPKITDRPKIKRVRNA